MFSYPIIRQCDFRRHHYHATRRPPTLHHTAAAAAGGGVDGGVSGTAGRVGGDFWAIQVWGDGWRSLLPHRRGEQDHDRRE